VIQPMVLIFALASVFNVVIYSLWFPPLRLLAMISDPRDSAGFTRLRYRCGPDKSRGGCPTLLSVHITHRRGCSEREHQCISAACAD